MKNVSFKSRRFSSNYTLETFIVFNKIEQNQIVSITESDTSSSSRSLSIHFYSDKLNYDLSPYIEKEQLEIFYKKPLFYKELDTSVDYDYQYDNLITKFKVKNVSLKPRFLIKPEKLISSNVISLLPVLNNSNYEEGFIELLSDLNPSYRGSFFEDFKNKRYDRLEWYFDIEENELY
jgi:hypothetical protein